MIVTIDGPAGAGKSTVARALARRLGYAYLDTGAMYRAVALAALRKGVDCRDPAALAALARQTQIEAGDGRVFLDGEDVTQEVRSVEVTAMTCYAADNPEVRQHLVDLQRRVARAGDNLVTEGRDQGSVVFPEAACKIYLTASVAERARRRQRDLEAQGQGQPLGDVEAQIASRDAQDRARAVGPLVEPPDALVLSTDGLSESDVVERLAALVQSRAAADSLMRRSRTDMEGVVEQ